MADVFSPLRLMIGEPRDPNLSTLKYEDELYQMAWGDGLMVFTAKSPLDPSPDTDCPEITDEMKDGAHLWVVREQDTVHAREKCELGQSLGNGKIKHTNLTGGCAAYTGGEMLWLGEQEILINGCSGRYGPKSAAEMQAAEKGFTCAGYRVWTTGYDEGTGYSFRFGASAPIEVQPK